MQKVKQNQKTTGVEGGENVEWYEGFLRAKIEKCDGKAKKFESWKEKDSSKGWTTKYYKGLGTSTSKEAKEYFVNVDDKLIKYSAFA